MHVGAHYCAAPVAPAQPVRGRGPASTGCARSESPADSDAAAAAGAAASATARLPGPTRIIAKSPRTTELPVRLGGGSAAGERWRRSGCRGTGRPCPTRSRCTLAWQPAAAFNLKFASNLQIQLLSRWPERCSTKCELSAPSQCHGVVRTIQLESACKPNSE